MCDWMSVAINDDKTSARCWFVRVEIEQRVQRKYERSYGVMVSTQDSESCDPGSNPGMSSFFIPIHSSPPSYFDHISFARKTTFCHFYRLLSFYIRRRIFPTTRSIASNLTPAQSSSNDASIVMSNDSNVILHLS